MEKRLSEMEPGEEGRVIKIETKQKRLMDMGIVKGAEIKVIRKAPLGDPVEFFLRGYNLSLRKEDASVIWVKINDS